MKIVILAVRDTGGTGYTLAHAINKITPEHQAINIRGMNSYIAYPTIVDMADYDKTKIRDMIYGSDVTVFLGGISPFFDFFKLKRNRLKDTKKMLLCMGSEWRLGRDQLMKQADKLLGDYKIVLGGADMFLPLEFPHPETGALIKMPAADESTVGYLPVVRSFDELQACYGISKPDAAALESFAVPRKRVVFTHAPTSETNKGSFMFYRAATRAQQSCPSMVFTTIRQQPWATTLSIIAKSDVLYDQAPPFPTAYGALSVEAGIFRLPSFSQVAPECRAFIERHTGLKTPHIVFSDEEDLYKKTVLMATDEKLRREFGEMNYQYCRQLHDEKPVVQRFFDIVGKM
jgi:hypothetical protein